MPLYQHHFKAETVYSISDTDFGNLIETVYGVEAGFCIDNYTNSTVHIKQGNTPDPYFRIPDGIDCYQIQSILQDLCDRGLILPGKYNVSFFW